MFGLTPQKLKPEYQNAISDFTNLTDIKVSWFEPFVKDKEITWQQWVFLLAVKRAVNHQAPNRICVASGRGIGKSATLAIVVIWYLFCFKNAQIPCTAPTSQQMHDVLWKEVQLWLNRMPKHLSEKFEWSNSYIRVIESPVTWFARAVTARKEAPDSLAGVHGEYVCSIADEASGIPDSVFSIGEGSLTGPNTLFVMVSNYRRLMGYFHAARTEERDQYQVLTFNSEESPVVQKKFLDRIALRGKDSDEYRIEVLGLPPKADTVDDLGYVGLLQEQDLRFSPYIKFIGKLFLGVDPAGEGRNETVWVVRDSFRALIVAKEKISNEISIASKTIAIMENFGIPAERVVVDSFGVGEKTVRELYKLRKYVIGVNGADVADDKERFLNKRAEMAWRLRDWILAGHDLVGTIAQWRPLLSVRYCIDDAQNYGKIKMMSKEKMRKEGFPSPDVFDALAYTFYQNPLSEMEVEEEEPEMDDFERHTAI